MSILPFGLAFRGDGGCFCVRVIVTVFCGYTLGVVLGFL